MSTPVPAATSNTIVKQIPLLKGFQWVSFNATDHRNASQLSLERIKGMQQGDQIIELDGNGIITFDDQGNAIGNFSSIDFKKGYLVKSSSDKLITIQGVEASVRTDIPIQGSYATSYIGYIPNVMLTAPYALRSLSNRFTIGDRISGREGFAEYTDEGWQGTLTHLIPNKGYAIKMLHSGIINYSGIISNTTESRQAFSKSNITNHDHTSSNNEATDHLYLINASKKGIHVTPESYPMSMSLTSEIISDIIIPSTSHTLVAMYKNEYRGLPNL